MPNFKIKFRFVYYLILIFFLDVPLQLLGQESKYLGGYYTVYWEVRVADKWSLFNENELRGIHVLDKHYHYEIKAGANYKASKKLTLTLALGVYSNYNEGAEYEKITPKTDYRIWQQLNYKQKFFTGVLDHRVRIEEVINANFRPSVRYRVQPKIPLNKKSLSQGALFATVYDELFFQFRSPVVRINRIFAGMGYYFSKDISVQAGILRQTDYKPGSMNFTKNFLYFAGSFRL